MITLGLIIAGNNGSQSIHHHELTDTLDSFLPQTQCGQCGYASCRPYAEAIAHNEADINQCPPGGATTIKNIAKLLGREIKPLNPDYGIEKTKLIAFIDEEACIGCVKCIRACPVDAIIGTARQMHTVIIQECTGCELCIDPCPVDCITMITPDSYQNGLMSLISVVPSEKTA